MSPLPECLRVVSELHQTPQTFLTVELLTFLSTTALTNYIDNGCISLRRAGPTAPAPAAAIIYHSTCSTPLLFLPGQVKMHERAAATWKQERGSSLLGSACPLLYGLVSAPVQVLASSAYLQISSVHECFLRSGNILRDDVHSFQSLIECV